MERTPYQVVLVQAGDAHVGERGLRLAQVCSPDKNQERKTTGIALNISVSLRLLLHGSELASHLMLLPFCSSVHMPLGPL